MTLQEIEQPTLTIDIVVGQIELRDPGAGQAQRTVLCKDPFAAVDARVERLIEGM